MNHELLVFFLSTYQSIGADVLYPLDVARRTYGLVPQSTVKSFKVVDGAPHLLSWTHPTVVSEQFMDFMRNQVLA